MVNRKRRSKYKWLESPDFHGVTTSKGFFIYRPWCKITKRLLPQKTICKTGVTRTEFLKAFDAIKSDSQTVYNFEWLGRKYFSSNDFSKLAKATQKQRKYYQEYLSDIETDQGLLIKLPLDLLTPRVMQQVFDTLADTPYLSNNVYRYMRLVFNWGKRRFDPVKENPCIGVKQHKVESRKRYITDDEYNKVYKQATPWYIKPMMEIAYLCCIRSCEVFSMQRNDIKKDYIRIKRSKGSKTQRVTISPRLRFALNAAKNKNAKSTNSHYLFYGNDGQPVKIDAFRTAWGKLMDRCLGKKPWARKRGEKPIYKAVINERFTFHDLKHKGITDHDDERAGGHQTKKMHDLYDHSEEEIDATK